MRVYRVFYEGPWLAYSMIVVEENKQKAYGRAVKELKKRDLWEGNETTFTENDVEEIARGEIGVYSFGEGH